MRFHSKYEDYREVNNKKTLYNNNKLNMVLFHEELSKLDSFKIQLDYDATISCPTAVWDQNSVYPKIENGFAFKPDMNDVYVEALKNHIFDQNGNKAQFQKHNLVIHLILYFNIYQLKKNFKKIRSY